MIVAHKNPFASCRVESLRYRFPGFDFASQISQLEKLNWRAQILGPHGSGKTTLLLEAYEHRKNFQGERHKCRCWFISRDPNEQFDQWQSFCRDCTPEDIVFVDGIERLSWLKRMQILGRLPTQLTKGGFLPRSIVVTTHRNLGLPTWVRSQTTPALLQELLLELNPSADLSMLNQAQQILAAQNGNIREVFWQLYDQVS